MPQAITGVFPPELGEVTIMTVWPTLSATKAGQIMGRLCMIDVGVGIFTLGKVMALLLIGPAIGLFIFTLLPGVSRRYRLTNRRLMIETGLKPRPESWVELERFDSVEVVVLPGQEWYPAGDLVFRKGQIETFRLAGVSRPETFRRTCLEARAAYVGAALATA